MARGFDWQSCAVWLCKAVVAVLLFVTPPLGDNGADKAMACPLYKADAADDLLSNVDIAYRQV